jgi:hypothetical protein
VLSASLCGSARDLISDRRRLITRALVQTPGGLLLRRSTHEEDRPALFAAKLALSQACSLVTYLVVGVVRERDRPVLDLACSTQRTSASPMLPSTSGGTPAGADSVSRLISIKA